MAEEYKFKISAIDDTKRAWESVKQQAKGVSLQGGAPGGAPGGAGAQAAPFSQKQIGRLTEKSLTQIVSLLKEIKKNTAVGIVGGGPSAVGGGAGGLGGRGGGLGGRGGGLGGMFGKKGGPGGGIGKMGGMFGKMGGMARGGGAMAARGLAALGPVGAAIGVGMVAGGFAYNQMGKIGKAFQSAASPQLGGIRTLGFGGGERAMGLFGGRADIGVRGSEQMEAAQEFGKQVQGETITNRFLMDHEKKRVRETSDAIASTKAAYGIGTGQLGRMAGRAERFGGPGAMQGPQFLRFARGVAEQTGMGGARMGEFMDNLQDAMESSIQSGMQTTNSELVKSLGTLYTVKDERLKALAPSVYRSQQQVFSQAADLEGGAGAGFAMRAVLKQLGPGASITEARKVLAKGPSADMMRAIVEDTVKLFGGNKEMAGLALKRMDFIKGKGPEAEAKMIDLYTRPSNKAKTQFDAEEAGMIADRTEKARLASAGEAGRLVMGPEIIKEMTKMNEWGPKSASAMVSVNKLMGRLVDYVTGTGGGLERESKNEGQSLIPQGSQ